MPTRDSLIIDFRPILNTTQTPLLGHPKGLHTLLVRVFSTFMVAGFLFLLVPTPAHAGFLSSLVKLFKGEDEPAITYNSQTMPLLSAPQSADSLPATGGAMVSMVGGASLLPVVGPLGSTADIELYKFDQITTYTVRDGDTLSDIAKMFGVSVNTIVWANNLKRGDLVNVGDVLVILPVSGIQYTVKKGDTVESLAKKFKSDADEIALFNGFELGAGLETGSTIIIPDAEIDIPAPAGRPSRVLSRGGPDLGGYFVRPIDGGRKTQGIHGYNGIDLANSCGTPVYASASGDVIIARNNGWNGGYGRYIVVSHPNGTQTVYGHLLGVAVGIGWHVPQGFQIGTIGSTGRSTGCHLHFEIRGAKNPF